MRHFTETTYSVTKNASWSTLKHVLKLFWQQLDVSGRWRMMVALGFLIISKLCVLCVPIIFKRIIDRLTTYQTPAPEMITHTVLILIVAYAGCRIASSLFNEVKEILFAPLVQQAVRQSGLNFFNYLHQQSLQFHLNRKTGTLIRVFERGNAAIEKILHFLIFSILPIIFQIIFVVGALWWMYGITIALLAGATIVAYSVFSVVVSEWRTEFMRQMNQQDNLANTQAIDSLLNYETVKYFGNEQFEVNRFNQSLLKIMHISVKVKASLSALNVGQACIVALGLLTILGIVQQRISHHLMTVGDFALIHNYIIELYIPLNLLGMVYREMKQNLINVEEMQATLTQPCLVNDNPLAVKAQIKDGVVTFDHVSFGYHPERIILKDIHFTIPAGQTFAVVGPSGSGKATLARLLFRFYDPDEGQILIDQQNIRLMTQQSLHALIGIVPQDTVLFNDTIFYNIQYGRPDATEAEVIQAATQAQVHAFIMKLPDGYQTMVGERGLRLSGGEKQRVAIARTLLKQPQIFLFDEATSALDTSTEKQIQESIQTISTNHTTLIIAHRLSTIVHAQQILVLENGEIVAQGTHTELLNSSSLYTKMWQAQQEEIV